MPARQARVHARAPQGALSQIPLCAAPRPAMQAAWQWQRVRGAVGDREKTRLVHAARARLVGAVGTVNPPVVRCSTVLYRDIGTRRAMRERREGGVREFTYGASGTPTTFALEDAITEIEGAARTMLFPSGLAAIAHVFHSLLAPGDHVLLAETIYGPARAIAVEHLARRGVACEFYRGGHETVAGLLRAHTRMVYLDNPGSIVYDIQCLPELAHLLRGRETLLAVDNTWGCPGLHRPLKLGADISIVALTKYVAGHSDLVMGAVAAGGRCADRLWRDANLFGQTVSPDDAFSVLKGLRTAAARLAMHQAHAKEAAAAAGRRPRPLPGAAERPRPRRMAARLCGCQRPAFGGVQASHHGGRWRSVHRQPASVRHRRLLGRVREPGAHLSARQRLGRRRPGAPTYWT